MRRKAKFELDEDEGDLMLTHGGRPLVENDDFKDRIENSDSEGDDP